MPKIQQTVLQRDREQSPPDGLLLSKRTERTSAPDSAQSAIFLEKQYIISAIFWLLTGKPASIHSRSMPTVP